MTDASLGSSKEKARKVQLLALATVLVGAGLATGGYWYFVGSHFVSTNNAYAAVEVAQVTPAISGTVCEIRVTDTQQVKRGDLLVRIDPTDAKLALVQAEADLDRAVRRVRGYQANDGSLMAQVNAREADQQRIAAQLVGAEADLDRARVDLKRREALAASGAVSGDELTRAQNAFATAKASVDGLRAAARQASANRATALSSKKANATLIDQANEQTNPEVALARARRDQALVDLERTAVVAPVDGIVAKRQVQLGQRVQAGMPLLSVVPVQEMHVDANFKEVQLKKVRTGQPVQLHADLYGTSVTYHGTVEGFAGGSGAAFSAIPAQNATGNWIKVVQRLPVRIRLDGAELRRHPLKVGLSMTAEIDTRAGQTLARTAHDSDLHSN
ncbi:hemolysin D [Geomonas silvestris]|uniref:Hemolysin D n=1 Tax=Geomonas silvestris TaxID=2740184 RepID=A0A6V8MGS7_9BACT|nr:HlyD family secretion protein [Geomonas silvestris]GFO59188.1 hemolysin D [Geomonas silvestris]